MPRAAREPCDRLAPFSSTCTAKEVVSVHEEAEQSKSLSGSLSKSIPGGHDTQDGILPWRGPISIPIPIAEEERGEERGESNDGPQEVMTRARGMYGNKPSTSTNTI